MIEFHFSFRFYFFTYIIMRLSYADLGYICLSLIRLCVESLGYFQSWVSYGFWCLIQKMKELILKKIKVLLLTLICVDATWYTSKCLTRVMVRYTGHSRKTNGHLEFESQRSYSKNASKSFRIIHVKVRLHEYHMDTCGIHMRSKNIELLVISVKIQPI